MPAPIGELSTCVTGTTSFMVLVKKHSSALMSSSAVKLICSIFKESSLLASCRVFLVILLIYRLGEEGFDCVVFDNPYVAGSSLSHVPCG